MVFQNDMLAGLAVSGGVNWGGNTSLTSITSSWRRGSGTPRIRLSHRRMERGFLRCFLKGGYG